MKRFIQIILFFFVIFGANAQTQKGIVKTRGRMINGTLVAGTRLQGVTVEIKGGPTVVTNKKGEFSVFSGNSFQIANVRKRGYELCDKSIIGRNFYYSDAPIVILLEDSNVLQQERITTEKKIRKAVLSSLQKREEEIERLRKNEQITQSEYNKKLHDLYSSQNHTESLVAEIIQHYSSLDFEQLDEVDRQIQITVVNGDILKADSLIKARNSNNLALIEEIVDSEEDLNAQLKRIKGIFKQDKYRLAEDFYTYYLHYLSENELDNARHMLRLRVELDSTNYVWNRDLGLCIFESFENEEDEALRYLSHSLKFSNLEFGFNNKESIQTLIAISRVHQSQGYFQIAYDELKAVFTSSTTRIKDGITHANVLEQLGIICNSMKKFDEAIECYNHALDYYVGNYHKENNFHIARCYNNIGVVLENKGEFGKALDFHMHALDLRQDFYKYDPDNPVIASTFCNIASIFDNLGASRLAMDYYKKGIDIYEKNPGKVELAFAYNNIASFYYNADSLASALHYSCKALTEIGKHYNEDNPSWITIHDNYNIIDSEIVKITNDSNINDIQKKNELIKIAKEQQYIADNYYLSYKFNESIKFYTSALMILKRLSSSSESYLYDLANVQHQLGTIYYVLHDYKNADNCLYSALGIYDTLFKKNPNFYRETIAEIQKKLGDLYFITREYSKSESCYNLALENFNALCLVDDKHYESISEIQRHIGDKYYLEGDNDTAEKYYRLGIENYGKREIHSLNATENIALIYSNIGNIYKERKDYVDCIELFKTALQYYEIIFSKDKYYGDVDGCIFKVQTKIGVCYYEIKDYTNSKNYLKLAENHKDLYRFDSDTRLLVFNYLALVYGKTHDYENCVYNLEIVSNYYWNNFLENVSTCEDLETILDIIVGLYDVLLQSKDEDKTQSYSLEGKKITLKYPDAYYAGLARVYLRRMKIYSNTDDKDSILKYEENYKKAIELYSSLYNSYPNEFNYSLASCYNQQAYHYLNLLDYQNAMSIIDQAIAICHTSEFYDSKGEILLMQGRNDEALEMWKKVMELNPNFLDKYPDGTNLSNGLKKLGLIE